MDAGTATQQKRFAHVQPKPNRRLTLLGRQRGRPALCAPQWLRRPLMLVRQQSPRNSRQGGSKFSRFQRSNPPTRHQTKFHMILIPLPHVENYVTVCSWRRWLFPHGTHIKNGDLTGWPDDRSLTRLC
jgi:hypothetical protein